MSYYYYFFLLLAFVAAILLFEGLYLLWNTHLGSESRRIDRRLRAMSAGGGTTQNISIIKERLLSDAPTMQRLLMEIPRVQHLDRLLLQSGLRMNVAKFLGLTLLAGVVGLVLGLWIGLPLLFIALIAIGAALLPLMVVFNARSKRMSMLEQQLPDTLDLLSRALRAGHAFPSALQMAGQEMPDPIAEEFRITFDEINYGVPLQDALMHLATRVPSADLRYFVIAVLTQKETGGNLAELLDNLSRLIRERLKLMGTIRVLSAEGRLSAWILTILPFALVGILFLIRPAFISILWTDPMGPKMIALTGVVMAVGLFWMWRIIKIRV